MSKPNLHFIRKKSSINEKSIKNLLILEEQYVRGKISKKMIEDMSKLYRKFLDYCIEIREPLKLYFQEKLEYLYLDQKVIQMLIVDEKQAEEDEILILNTEFLNFSEIGQNEGGYMTENYDTMKSTQVEGDLN